VLPSQSQPAPKHAHSFRSLCTRCGASPGRRSRYGDGGTQTAREQRAHVVSAIQGFCEDYKEAVLGVSRNLDDSRLYGSGCIREIFTTVFPEEVSRPWGSARC